MTEDPILMQQLGEEFVSKLKRIMLLEGVEPENWQKRIDELLVQWGLWKGPDGVWRRPGDLS